MVKTDATKSRDASLRRWTQNLALWRVCDNAACRHAQACRGNVRACTPKNFAAAPEGVQAWFCLLMASKQERLSFDEAMARMKDTPAEQAFALWHAGDEAGARNVQPG
jgi:hypothetical protein